MEYLLRCISILIVIASLSQVFFPKNTFWTLRENVIAMAVSLNMSVKNMMVLSTIYKVQGTWKARALDEMIGTPSNFLEKMAIS